MTELQLDPAPALPEGWQSRVPEPDDLARLVEIGTAQLRAARGSGSRELETVTALVVGPGSWTRRQVVAVDPGGTIRAWAAVHDRAAGRTMVDLDVDPELTDPDPVALALIAWQQEVALQVAAERPVEETQLDALVDEGNTEQLRWLAACGYRKTRTWLNMKRPVQAGERSPEPRAGVSVRRVAVHELEDGTTMPVAADLQAVHRMLEESFEDHFNSYRESFTEFAQRLREDPGHRWDHWWLALVELDGELVAGGALVSSLLTADDSGAEGSYVDYIGVHRRARGMGVAKALLGTVIADAADRGRNRVALEVDADSPTGADGLYRSLGWETAYVTESWQQHVRVPA